MSVRLHAGFGKRAKASGRLHAWSPAEVAQRGQASFSHKVGGRHACEFLRGTEVLVCRKCGLTKPIEEVPHGR